MGRRQLSFLSSAVAATTTGPQKLLTMSVWIVDQNQNVQAMKRITAAVNDAATALSVPLPTVMKTSVETIGTTAPPEVVSFYDWQSSAENIGLMLSAMILVLILI